ncbi:DNA replication and repair protein RecF [Candidatus Sumerlaeota bacterium]|nr:DNA replication and repair protein RecF [Candidatus Sumerlaeota bacterium]
MHISELTSENFRLLHKQAIGLAPGLNLFSGENAQGKTSLLEAVSYLSSGRSFRTSRDRDCIRFKPSDAPADEGRFAAAECSFVSHEVQHKVRCAITPTEKVCWVDGNKLAKLGDLWGVLNTVVFVPTDIELVRGGPELRRALIGELLARTSRYDLQVMQRYALALRERNALLRDQFSTSNEQFDVFENQMAEYGAKLLTARERMIRHFAMLAQEHLHQLTGGRDRFQMSHESGWPRAAGLPKECLSDDNPMRSELKSRLLNLWEHDREADAERGFTQNGPHRGDVAFSLNDRDARTFCSQGQARTIALALRLAEVEVLTILSAETPVLLLDDILGDLDQSRIERFAELLSKRGLQSLITSTDASTIETRLPVAAHFRVLGGEVKRIGGFA